MKIRTFILVFVSLLYTTKAYGDQNPVSSAPSFQLTSSNDTCMGSSVAGAQNSLFGFSIGSAWTDKNCIRLKLAKELEDRGFKQASLGLICKDEEVREVMENAGTPCPASKVKPENKVINATNLQYPTEHKNNTGRIN